MSEPVCPVPECDAWGGTAQGSPPMRCGAYGAGRREGPCLAEWLMGDPEDLGEFPSWTPIVPPPAAVRVQPRRTTRRQRRRG